MIRILKLFLRTLKYSLIVIGAIIIVLFAISYWPISPPDFKAKFDDNIIFRNANVLLLDKDSIIFNTDILVANGTIKRIGASIYNKEDCKVVDLLGKFVIPGLIDMHVHVFDESDLYLNLSKGITTIRNMSGFPQQLQMREAIEEKKLLGPDIITSGPQIDGPLTAPNAYTVTNPDEAKIIVAKNVKDGFDWIKAYDGLSYAAYNSVLQEAKRLNIPLASHVPNRFSIDSIIQDGLVSIEHFEELYKNPFNYKPDTTKVNYLIEKLLEHNVSVCPTIVTIENVTKMCNGTPDSTLDSLDYMPVLVRKVSKANAENWGQASEETKNYYKEQLDFHLFLLKKLNDAGVNIIAGTDAPAQNVLPAFGLYKELNLYKKSGLNNWEVLKTTTVNAAIVLGKENSIGLIKEGLKANMVILDNNPIILLSTIQNPYAVVKDGALLERGKLKILESHAKNEHRNLFHNIRQFIIGIVYTYSK